VFARQLIAATHPSVLDLEPDVSLVDPEAMLRVLEAQQGWGFWRLSLSGALHWSAKAFMIHGLPISSEPIDLGRALNCYQPGDRRRVAELFATALETGCGFRYALRVETEREAVRVIECVADVIWAGDEMIGLFGACRDITRRAMGEAAALSRSKLLRDLIELIPAPVIVLDHKMTVLAGSEHWRKACELTTQGKVLGKNLYVLEPDTPAEWKAQYAKALSGVTVSAIRNYYSPTAQRHIARHCVISPWTSSRGTVGGIVILAGAEVANGANDDQWKQAWASAGRAAGGKP